MHIKDLLISLLFLFFSPAIYADTPTNQARIQPAYFAESHPQNDADSLIELLNRHYLYYGSYSKNLVQELYRLAETSHDPDLLVTTIYWDALVEYSQRNDKTRLSARIDSLLHIPKLVQNPRNRLLLDYALALSELAYGDFPGSFRHALDAYHQAVALNDRNLIVSTAATLGNIGPYIQDYELSRRYYRIALQQCEKPSPIYWRTQINFYNLFSIEGQYDSAISNLLKIIPDIAQSKDSGLLGICFLNLGSYYSAIDQRDSAYDLYMKSLSLTQKLDNNNIRLVLYGNIGNYFRDKEDYTKAKYYYHEARRIALEDSNMNAYASMAYKLSILFSKQGVSDSSYQYLIEYNNLISRIQQPQTIESYKHYVDMVMELSENQIQLSEQTVSLKNKQLIILGITAFGIIVAAILFWIITIERRRSMRQTVLLKEIENKELSDRLKHEQDIQALQHEKMEQNIRELTSYTLLLANKNQLLKTIEETATQAEHDYSQKGYATIRRLIGENLHLDENYWQQFVNLFVQVDPHFFNRLKQRFPDLTTNETKLCAYIRIGMSPQQIAQISNVSPESVNKNRYRLRKKLGLEQGETLDNVITEL